MGDWLFEIKFDGYRALALRRGDETGLLSRNRKDLSKRFLALTEAVAALDVKDDVLDGEIVALDDLGRSSFQSLQSFRMESEKPPIVFYVFDLLYLNNRDLRALPIEKRKARLEALLAKIRYSVSFVEHIDELLKRARGLQLEGLIGKRFGSRYEAGKRSGAWIKLKLCLEQEVVIGGYTESGQQHFGALLVGVYEGKRLKFAGRVGTGFSERVQEVLFSALKTIRVKRCPFSNLTAATGRSRLEKRFGRSELKNCRWVKPVLVCQIAFAEWTRGGYLRQPSFIAIRTDKNPTQVILERHSQPGGNP